MKKVVIESDLMEFRGVFLFDCTHAEAAKWCLKNWAKGKPDDLKKHWEECGAEKKDSCDGVTWSHQGDFVVWLSESPFTSRRGKMLLAHEAAHASLKVLKHWSIDPLERAGDEMNAVLVGYFTKKVFAAK